MATKSKQKNTTNKENQSFSKMIIRPRITEKGTDLAHFVNAYVFEVAPQATKRDIIKGIFEIYKVTPVDVRVVPIRSKTVFVRGKKGQTRSGKKAYVYLKKGDKIEFV